MTEKEAEALILSCVTGVDVFEYKLSEFGAMWEVRGVVDGHAICRLRVEDRVSILAISPRDVSRGVFELTPRCEDD